MAKKKRKNKMIIDSNVWTEEVMVLVEREALQAMEELNDKFKGDILWN